MFHLIGIKVLADLPYWMKHPVHKARRKNESGISKPGVIDGLIEAYDKMVPQLKKLDMKIINCTPQSALTSFPMSTLEEEL